MINRRIDPALDKRRLIVFFAGLIAFYVGVLLITQPVLNGGEAELDKFVIGVMLAPIAAVSGRRLAGQLPCDAVWTRQCARPARVVLMIARQPQLPSGTAGLLTLS
jgi:hypothetical protein